MAIVLFFLSLILFISLFSYDPNDPGFNTTGNKEISNFIGLIGAYFSSTSFVFFGVASYFIPLLFISFAVSVIQEKETKTEKDREKERTRTRKRWGERERKSERKRESERERKKEREIERN